MIHYPLLVLGSALALFCCRASWIQESFAAGQYKSLLFNQFTQNYTLTAIINATDISSLYLSGSVMELESTFHITVFNDFYSETKKVTHSQYMRSSIN